MSNNDRDQRIGDVMLDMQTSPCLSAA